MPFFFHPMFLPAMWFGAYLAFMPIIAMTLPQPRKKCVILQFPTKKRLTI